MQRDQNVICITGTITKDMELKYAASGVAYLKLAVANNYGWDKEAKKSKTNFYNIDAFGKQAEKYSELLKKGDKVIVMGNHVIDNWEYNGKSGVRSQIINETITLAGEKKSTKHKEKEAKSENEEPEVFEEEDDDEFPF